MAYDMDSRAWIAPSWEENNAIPPHSFFIGELDRVDI